MIIHINICRKWLHKTVMQVTHRLGLKAIGSENLDKGKGHDKGKTREKEDMTHMGETV